MASVIFHDVCAADKTGGSAGSCSPHRSCDIKRKLGVHPTILLVAFDFPFLYCCSQVISPIKAVLATGITPSGLGISVAFGISCGLFPVPGQVPAHHIVLGRTRSRPGPFLESFFLSASSNPRPFARVVKSPTLATSPEILTASCFFANPFYWQQKTPMWVWRPPFKSWRP
jgi:hypothetical protein